MTADQVDYPVDGAIVDFESIDDPLVEQAIDRTRAASHRLSDIAL
jgi:hypothetical protein